MHYPHQAYQTIGIPFTPTTRYGVSFEDWLSGVKYLYQQAVGLADQVRANPKAYERQVASFVRDLELSRANLDRMKAALPLLGNTVDDTARYNRLARQHYELKTRFDEDTQRFGVVPVMLIGALAVGAAAAAWAAVAWQLAVGLREETALGVKELDARVYAMRSGRQLQPSTLQSPSGGKASSLEALGDSALKGAGSLLAAGLVLFLGLNYGPQLLKRR